MGYPKQPGQDAEAHRRLAVRQLELLQRLASARPTAEAVVAARGLLRTPFADDPGGYCAIVAREVLRLAALAGEETANAG